MNKSRDVWVFIEQEVGGIAAVSLELLSKARDLAQKLDSRVWRCPVRSRGRRSGRNGHPSRCGYRVPGRPS